MTDTVDRAADPRPPPSGAMRRPRWSTLVALAVGVIVVIGVVGFFAFRGGSSSSPTSVVNPQLASLRQACQQWSGIDAPSLGTEPAVSACTAMAGWMSQQLGDGRMTGSMMWGSASAMATTCRQWMSTSAVSSPAWCDEMVAWMQQRIGNWNGWMMNGAMMGGS